MPAKTRRAFLPSIDPCEARVVLSGLVAVPHTLPTAAQVAASGVHAKAQVDINTQVLAFAKKNLGKKVGDGECATLASEAVKSAGGVSFSKLGPTGVNANYVWGRKIT